VWMYLNYDAQLLVKPNRFLRRILHWHLLESDLENVQYQGIVGIGVLFHSRPLLCCRSSLSTLSLSVFSPSWGGSRLRQGGSVSRAWPLRGCILLSAGDLLYMP
jgi:hypothetical protein